MGEEKNEYQLQRPHVGLVPHVLPEVEAVHILVDETKGMCLGRVHPHEGYYIHVSVVKESHHVHFVVEPLRESCQL